MADSDRTFYKKILAGILGAARQVANQTGVVAQDAQRYFELNLTAGTAANAVANYSLARLDRPVTVKEIRVLPSAAVTVSGNTTFVVGYTNDGGGAMTNVAVFNTNQNANFGLGNLAQWTSVAVNAALGLQLANLAVPSGSHIVLKQIATSPSEALPAGTAFQVIWEET